MGLPRPSEDQKAFEEAILESPDDVAPRLIYADWLLEHGHDDEEHVMRNAGGRYWAMQYKIRRSALEKSGITFTQFAMLCCQGFEISYVATTSMANWSSSVATTGMANLSSFIEAGNQQTRRNNER